ncbi:MAG: DUF1330 domain-containing protein [Gammaproteobacteria bacterium]|nr:DUF1330 domain-containing protein [Gammaproteobacteria bacterium]
MPAYMIVQATVTKPEQFAEYAQRMPALVAKYGGKYLALGGAVEKLEGDWDHQALVISEWPSMDAARTLWHSDDYAELKKVREGAVDVSVLLVEGA